MSQQIRFAWATKPKPDQAEESGATKLDPQAHALVLALMARVLVAVVRVQEEVSDDR